MANNNTLCARNTLAKKFKRVSGLSNPKRKAAKLFALANFKHPLGIRLALTRQHLSDAGHKSLLRTSVSV